LYWSDGANILRVPKAGGQSEVVVANVPQPSEMLVDNDNLYWMIWVGEGSAAAPLMMAPKSGGGVAREISPPQPGASGFCISSEAVFWMAHSGINRVSKTGGEVTLVYPNPDPNGLMDGLQQDAENFYFKRSAERGRTALMKLAKAGGEPIEIAPSISLTMEFVADGSDVYYFDNEKGYGSFGPVSLRKVARSGGEPVTLDTGGAGWVNYIAIDDKQVYFTDIARVYALAK
jgi:hypothetical protein